MSASGIHTLSKDERICGRTLIERLFSGGGGRSMSAFPLRLVYIIKTGHGDEIPPVEILVSVPKRCFKRAIRRNKVKRQVREAYRLNKNILYDMLRERGNTGLAVAFIWMDDKLWPTHEVEKRVVSLMHRLAEKL